MSNIIPLHRRKGPTLTKRGYLVKEINGRQVRMHRYIWELIHGPIPDGYVIHHIDGNKTNNLPSNLELLTNEEHMKLHRGQHGIDARFNKYCSRCATVKPRTEFHRNGARKDGLTIYCKVCWKAFMLSRRAGKRDRLSARPVKVAGS